MNNKEYFELKSLYQFKKQNNDEHICYCIPYISVNEFKINDTFLILKKVKIKNPIFKISHESENSEFIYKILINGNIKYIFEDHIKFFDFGAYFKKLC